MTFDFDTTRAARSPVARRRLVDAVLAAAPYEQELDWIEWKSPHDIQSHRGVIAKQILGFANREVGRAALHAEGCGYLLLGAAPGNDLVGVDTVDFADLTNWLDPYVGGIEGPQWDPAYVDVGGTKALLITVDAPRDGDRPWPLRREWNPGRPGEALQAGAIFTRRLGKTVPADAAEQDMLWRRSRATSRRLAVDVRRSDAAVLRTFDASPEAIARWVEKERKRLLRPLAPRRAPSSPEILGGEFEAGASSLARLADLARVGNLIGLPEDRTEEEYRSEVDAYLDSASAAMPGHARWLAVKRRLAVLPVHVVNLTEIPYAEFEVQLHIPGAVHAWWTPWHAEPRPRFPSAPRTWGPRTSGLLPFLGETYRPHLGSAVLNSPIADAPRGWIRNSKSAMVSFLPFDLRPTETWGLDEVLLAVGSALAGQTISVRWEATSTNAHGRETGEFEVTFASEPLALPDLLTKEDADDADTDEDQS